MFKHTQDWNISQIIAKFVGGSERTATVKRNILGSIALKGISIIVQLLLVPLTLSYLSEELYGIWLTISSVILWLNFFDVGFSLGLKNRLAEAVALKNFEKGKKLVSTTYGMLVLIFIPLGIILEFIVPHINWSKFLNVSYSYNPILCDVMRILIVSFVLQMITNVIVTIVSAYQKVALGSSFSIIGNIISLIVVWLLTRYTAPSMINLAYAVSGIPVVVFAISSLILFHGTLKAVKPSVKSFRKSAIKDIFSLGIKFFIIQIQLIIMQQATNILISNVSNPDYVTFYNIAYRYIGTAMMLFSLVLGPLWPAFTDAYTNHDFSWMQIIYRKLVKLYYMILGTIWIMFVLSDFVYGIWIGKDVMVPWAMTFGIAIYFSIFIWDSFQINLINGIGTVKLQTFVTLIGIVFHIPLSFFLGKYIGAYGVIASLCLITAIYASFFTVQIRKILNRRAQGIWIE